MSKELINLLNYNHTILDYDDFSLIFKNLKREYLKVKVLNLCKQWIIEKLSKWLFYIKSKWYDIFEIPTKLYSPSYISFFSALYHYWIIFQLPETITFAYKRNIEKLVWWNLIYSKRLKESILYNTTWIISSWRYSIANLERAFLDTLYIYPDYYFDNLRKLNKDKIIEILPIYENKAFEKRVLLYLKNI